MAKTRKTGGKGRQLVLGYLERVSSKVFSDFPRELTDLVKDHHGVYALYKGDRLYYVGLATNLRNRIKHHLSDRHAGKWDKFSLYLVRKADHVKELESLILRIADPKGNLAAGKLSGAENLQRDLLAKLRRAQDEQIRGLIGGRVGRPKTAGKAKRSRKAAQVASSAAGKVRLGDCISGSMTIRGTRSGRSYEAAVRRDGSIDFGEVNYRTPSAAGKAATAKTTNGWRFWHYETEGGQWAPLDDLRHQAAGSTQAGRQGVPKLAPYVERLGKGAKLQVTYKKQGYTAAVKPDGSIAFGHVAYTSPSAAAKAITGHPTDGWHFWRWQNVAGDWVKLDRLRKGDQP